MPYHKTKEKGQKQIKLPKKLHKKAMPSNKRTEAEVDLPKNTQEAAGMYDTPIRPEHPPPREIT